MSGDHPNDSVIKIGQNMEKSPEDLRRLAVTKTSVKDHQLMLVWKTLKGVKNNTYMVSSIPNNFQTDLLDINWILKTHSSVAISKNETFISF